jgi:hypothetical protein
MQSLLAVLAVLAAGAASTPSQSVRIRFVVDGVAVRFTSPETGGATRPRFVMQRELSFEARLLACAEEGKLAEPQERHIRQAVEQHIAVEMLSRLPLDPEPDAAALGRVARILQTAVIDRVGGEKVVQDAGAVEGFESSEIDAMFIHEARAALYVERAITPVLYPSEETLRDVYRTTAHPYRGSKYEDVRDALDRWFAFERLRSAEAQFLQNARTRVKVAYTAP